ncbi:phosphatidate cytidylyltransferase [Calidifontibacter sp. DB0510]|uniref:Phosphatidate cytidylyltransferase n=1 Tax=Metallococcus carri TaxID=1656884 RepID=A0A967B0X3_9MICO|nr:phosphatidate cytidylyltransferase [Metallococcus carri]NHN55989.1 phosphatidate cytidylyltransferase [Metallococcus carri]NOP37554.1 phosphatidate cytidylyltransferase [Calidifontibacter sp. DB2511S]
MTGTVATEESLPHQLLDTYLRILHLDRRSMRLDIDFLFVHLHITGRGVFFFWVTLGILTLAGIAVFASRKRELITKWVTWVMILPVVGIPIWIGRGPTAVLCTVLALISVREYARLVQLRPVDTAVLYALSVAYPLAAWLRPGWLHLVPLVVLLCGLPSVLAGDLEHGVRRAAFTGFGSIWICWSLASMVLIWRDAFLVCFAAAATDVAAWCGGKGFRRFAWARRSLSPLSPNKTVGGLAGAVIGAFVVLTLLGTISLGLLLAVAFGGVLGDLLESMVKRQAGVKDAGEWLPGFGGLLDRIDSLLLVLPLAAVALT